MRILSVVLVLFSFGAMAQIAPESPAEREVRLNEMNRQLAAFSQAFQQSLKPGQDNSELKKFLGYFELTEEEKKNYDDMWAHVRGLSSAELFAVQSEASAIGRSYAFLALDPASEERLVPVRLESPEENFVNTSAGAVYAKKLGAHTGATGSPLMIGGGFPFHQAQFEEFNDKLRDLGPSDLYDPICNGMSVLFDVKHNAGKTCRPYQAKSPRELFRDELALAEAYTRLSLSFTALPLTTDQKLNSLFRLSRISYRGISLVNQAHALKMLADSNGRKKGEAILAGLSYGGLLAAKTGALYPGTFKSIVLFSPGINNAAHEGPMATVSAMFEGALAVRSATKKIIKDVAHSPRYDAYRPTILDDHDGAFRDSLQTKMLGELDMNIADDLVRLKDRVFMITGGKDSAIPPKSQIAAMRALLTRNPGLGTFILIPRGGHALWGNPQESQEEVVVEILREIQKGDEGLFKADHSYVWREEERAFEDLGPGTEALAKAQLITEK